MNKRRATLQQKYALVQGKLTDAKRDVEFFQQEHAKAMRRALDAEQRNVLLYDTNRLLTQIVESQKRQLAQHVRADELKTSDLKLAS